jgi:peptidoglycan-associated lipoprotein
MNRLDPRPPADAARARAIRRGAPAALAVLAAWAAPLLSGCSNSSDSYKWVQVPGPVQAPRAASAALPPAPAMAPAPARSPAPAASVTPVTPAASAAPPAAPAVTPGVMPAPAPVPMPAPPPPVTQSDFALQAGDRVFFETNRSDLSLDARSTLDRQAQWLRSHPGVKVRVEGNADARGAVSANVALGQRRAEEVRRHLITRGVAPDRVTATTNGTARPIEHGAAPNSLAYNRNVQTILVTAW